MRSRHAVVHRAVAHRPGRRLRRWQRMRARLGLFAVWIAIAFWSMGASLDPPQADAAPASATLAEVVAPRDTDIAAEGMLAPSIDTEGALAAGDATAPADVDTSPRYAPRYAAGQ